MIPVTIELPESLLATSSMSREELEQDARFLLAAKMFELGRLSSGQAARVCGMNRVDFLYALGSIGVSMIQMDVEDLKDELARGLTPRG